MVVPGGLEVQAGLEARVVCGILEGQRAEKERLNDQHSPVQTLCPPARTGSPHARGTATRWGLQAHGVVFALGLASSLGLCQARRAGPCSGSDGSGNRGQANRSLGILTKGVDRLSVGTGMVPRGEVGLIFANIGLTLTLAGKPVVDHALFSAILVMVIVTTMITPPALKWSLSRSEKREAAA